MKHHPDKGGDPEKVIFMIFNIINFHFLINKKFKNILYK